MCYYSQTLRRETFRDAKEGEDLRIAHDGYSGHSYPMGDDGKVACVSHGAEVHIEKFELDPQHMHSLLRNMPFLQQYLGKPLDTVFSPRNQGYAADHILVENRPIHFVYLLLGTKFYCGPKRPEAVDMDKRLGVDDPSINLDHNVDQTPTLARTVGRALGVCSIRP